MIFTTKKKINMQVEEAVNKAIKSNLFKQMGRVGGGRGIPSILGGGITFNESDISLQTFKDMENDAGIIAPLTIVKAPIRSVEWSIECENNDIKDFVKKALLLIWEQLIGDMLLALNFGFQSFEKVFTRNNDGIVYKKLLAYDPADITVKTNEKTGGFAGIELSQVNKPMGAIQLPPQKCFHFAYDMRWGNFYGISKMRPAYKYWFTDKYYYEFQNVFMEKLSGGVVVAYAPSGKTVVDGVEYDNIETMKKVAQDIRSGGVASLPSEMWGEQAGDRKWILELLESKKDTGQFVKAHEHLDTMKSRAIFVPDLIYKAEKVGSFALGKEHTNNFILSIKAILDYAKLFIDSYLIPQLVEYNFGINAPRAEWVYSTLSPATIDFLKDLVIELTKKDRAEIPDWDFIFSALGVPVPSALKNGGKGVGGGTGEEDNQAENKRHPQCGDIHFKREPANKWEKRIDFQKIEGQWDDIDNRIIDYMTGYLDDMKDSILAQYTKQMEAGKIDPNSIKISGVKEYKAQLKKYMNEALTIGMESVISELKTDQKFTVSNDTKNWIDTTINNMVNKQLEDLRFQLGSGIEETIQANLQKGGYDKSTINEATTLAEENYDSRIKLSITINARKITSRGVNQGRSIVAEGIE